MPSASRPVPLPVRSSFHGTLTMNLPEKIYSERELTRAKTSAKLVGWMQGAGIVLGGALLWNLLGWIPVLIGLGGGGWLTYKLLSGGKDEDEA
jgi:hypothetical protein